MFLESSIMHELINKHTSLSFLAKPKKLYQVSVMYPWKKSHLNEIEAYTIIRTSFSHTNSPTKCNRSYLEWWTTFINSTLTSEKIRMEDIKVWNLLVSANLSKGKNDKKKEEKQGDVDKNTSAEGGYKISGQGTNIAKRTWVKPSPFHFLCLFNSSWMAKFASVPFHYSTFHFCHDKLNKGGKLHKSPHELPLSLTLQPQNLKNSQLRVSNFQFFLITLFR